MFSMEERKINFEGLSDEEVKKFVPVLKDFMQAYADKDKNIDDKEWLKRKLKEELPELTEEEVEVCSEDIITGVKKVDENIESIEKAHTKGIKSDEWLMDTFYDASIGIGVDGFGQYLSNIDATLKTANANILKAVLCRDGTINQNPSLDGYIAEQLHVNSFNKQAAVNLRPFVAKVNVPKSGSAYGKNSVDISICDKYNGFPLHRYQVKYGKDAQATIRCIREGNYNNQIIVVPKGQVEEVQAAFPGKTVTDHIGGTKDIGVSSEALSKTDVKKFQNNVQEKSRIKKETWNSFETKEIAKNIGRMTVAVSVITSVVTAGFDVAARVFKGEKIKSGEVIKDALVSGADTGVKCAAAGALTVAVRKGIIKVISRNTPAGVLVCIATAGIENVKIFSKFASGKITAKEALDKMGRTSVAIIGGISLIQIGSEAGVAFTIAALPIISPWIGMFVGGGVAYCVGAKFGNMVYDGAKKIATVAKNVVKSVCNGVKNTVSSICTGIKNFFTW